MKALFTKVLQKGLTENQTVDKTGPLFYFIGDLMNITSNAMNSSIHSSSNDPMNAGLTSKCILAMTHRQFRGARLKNFKNGKVGFTIDGPHGGFKHYLNSFAEFQQDEHFFSKVLPCEDSKILLQYLLKEDLDLILISESSFKDILKTWPNLQNQLALVEKSN